MANSSCPGADFHVAAAIVTHELVVPYGDDPVVVSIVRVTNTGPAPADGHAGRSRGGF